MRVPLAFVRKRGLANGGAVRPQGSVGGIWGRQPNSAAMQRSTHDIGHLGLPSVLGMTPSDGNVHLRAALGAQSLTRDTALIASRNCYETIVASHWPS